MGDPAKNEADTFAAIDGAQASDRDKRDSRILYQALHRNRDAVGGQAALPPDDQHLSERILAEARSRSAEIAANQRQGSARHSVSGAPIPVWLWLAWIVAIGGLVAAFWYWR